MKNDKKQKVLLGNFLILIFCKRAIFNQFVPSSKIIFPFNELS